MANDRLDKYIYKMKTSCINKKAYRTERYAWEVAKKMQEKYGVPFHCYWCKICGNYHLTRKPVNGKQKVF